MQSQIVNKIQFPEYTGIKCNMMPFIQGDSSSLPEIYMPYSDIVNNNFLEKGEVGLLSIDEAFVSAGESQRGYNSAGIDRNVHIEVGRGNGLNTWGPTWGGNYNTLLDEDTRVLIANSISDTCRLWDTREMSYTSDGDLSAYLERYPEENGRLMEAGEVAKISIFTPHECLGQENSGERQFFRIVGKGVTGREDYFTVNPLLN